MTTESLAGLAARTAELPSLRIAEIVLQTGRFDELKNWYRAVLGRPWSVENEPAQTATIALEHGDGGKQVHASRVRSCFMIMDLESAAEPYGQLFALFQLPGIGSEPTHDPGLNHMQFKHCGLDALMARVELLLDAGLRPHRSANHGPITSFYYRDPDKNVVELCCNNFPSFAEWIAYFASPEFKRNPSGEDMHFEDFLMRYRQGLLTAEQTRHPVSAVGHQGDHQ
jgi:catechol 2,3-dioxygenase-like lactoylglutathione lyase family enzyme